jgi:hypothetical protein
MKKIILLIPLIGLVIFTTACTRYTSEKNLDAISLRMNKQEVINKMSSKGVARGSILNKFGQVIEVREYKVDAGKTGDQLGEEIAFTIGTFGLGAPIFCRHGEIHTYWLYFCEGTLVQWGRSGDWAEAQKVIYDINFNVSKEK